MFCCYFVGIFIVLLFYFSALGLVLMGNRCLVVQSGVVLIGIGCSVMGLGLERFVLLIGLWGCFNHVIPLGF